MYSFDILKPTTIEEAIAALAQEDAQALAGGQTLIPTLKQRLASPETLVSLSNIAQMRQMSREGDQFVIGGAVTHAVVAGNGHYPALAHLGAGIGDPAVRNRGTIGGSLANNDPAACYPAAALASRAVIVTNAREITADDFFEDMFTTALEEGELIIAVKFAIPRRAAYQKFVQPASRFALVGVFVAEFADGGVRVAVTGASERGVFRWQAAETLLEKEFSCGVLQESADTLQLNSNEMLSDLHGSGEYRAHLVRVMAQRAVDRAVSGGVGAG